MSTSQTETRVVLLYAHPRSHRSNINRVLFRHAQQVEGVLTRDLYELYPDFDIDVEAEQQLLRDTRLLVVQHPVYWYSTPAILKEWLDTVLTRGFAYGRQGAVLHDKDFLQVVSTGGTSRAYSPQGKHRHSLDEFLLPMRQTARFCGMNYLDPLVFHGSGGATPALIEQHALRYRELLSAYAGNRH